MLGFRVSGLGLRDTDHAQGMCRVIYGVRGAAEVLGLPVQGFWAMQVAAVIRLHMTGWLAVLHLLRPLLHPNPQP